MTFPHPAGLTSEEKAKLDSIPPSSFRIKSSDTYVISADANAPTFLTTGFVQEDGIAPVGWEIDVATGGMKNVSGRTMAYNGGVYSFHASNVNASSRILYIFSEVSTDGGSTWTRNNDSAREQTISGTTAVFSTKQSEALQVPDQAIVRFGFYASATGVTFGPVVASPYSETVTGPSFRWRLTEDMDPSGFMD